VSFTLRRIHRRRLHVEAALQRWGAIRRRQADVAVVRSADQDKAEKWLAALDRRLRAEADLAPALQRWSGFRRRQADVAVARSADQDKAEKWLAALDHRLEDEAMTLQSDAAGDDSAVVVQAHRQAHDAISVLVQRATDDDVGPDLAEMAQDSLRSCVRLAMPPVSPPADHCGVDRILDLLDSYLATVAAWAVGRSWFPQPWVSRRCAFKLRSALAASVVAIAVAGAVAVGHGLYLLALPLLVGAASVDLLEGSIGRVTGTESPVGRWAASLLSHLGELVFITGIAWDQQRLGRPSMSTAVLAAGYLALYGSFVRTTARQVGTFTWSSMWERVARLSSFVAYLALSGAGLAGISDMAVLAPFLTAALFGGFGAWEALRVSLVVRARPIESITTVIEEPGGRCQSFVEVTDRRPKGDLMLRGAGSQ